jgi:hypothetical protein
LDAYFEACMARAAHKTLSNFEHQYQDLLDVSYHANVLTRILTTIPHGWDAQAFCENLALSKTIYPATDIAKNQSKKSLQAKCYDLACERSPLLPWCKLLSRRLKMFHTPDDVIDAVSSSSSSTSSNSSSSSESSSSSTSSSLSESEDNDSFQNYNQAMIDFFGVSLPDPNVNLDMITNLGKVLGALPEGVRMCFIKTLSNGWATTSRYHEAHVMSCFFGCKEHKISSKDSLKHYLYCNKLWEIVQGVTCHNSGPLNGPPSARLHIISPNNRDIYNWAVAFRIYHGLKFDYLRRVKGAQRTNNYEEVINIAKSLARFHWNDLRDKNVC